MLSTNKILELSKVHEPTCISIYLPTRRKGMPVLNQEDQLELRSLIKPIKKEISRRFKTEEEVELFLKPLTELAADHDFWRNQREGLAIFLDRNNLHVVSLDGVIDREYCVSTNFLLWPLIAFLERDTNYRLLCLSTDEVHLYQGSQDILQRVLVKELGAIRFEEVVGTDHVQKSLQFHGQQSGYKSSVYHGHGEGKDDIKDEILKYYHQVDEVIASAHPDQTTPLLLYGLDHLVGLFRKVNTYSGLLEEYLAGNPFDKNLPELHEKSWGIIKPHFEKPVKNKFQSIQQYLGTPRVSYEIRQIIKAAQQGKIDTLFLRAKKNIWGIFDPASNYIRVDDKHQLNNVSLTNLVALETMANGGEVYITEGEYLPDEYMDICALYRY